MLQKFNINNWFGIVLTALAVALPFSIKLTSIISILLVVIWIYEGKWLYKLQRINQNNWLHLFIGFYILHIIGLLYTDNLSLGLSDIEKKLSLILFPLIVGSSYSLRKDINLRDRVHRWFIISCCASLIFCLGHATYRFIEKIPPNSSVYGGFESTQQFKVENQGVSSIWEYFTYSELLSPLQLHPTYFSMFLLLAVAIVTEQLISFVTSKYSIKFYLRLALLAFFTVCIFLLTSRIAILAYMLLLTLQLYRFLRKFFFWKTIIAGCTIFLVVAAIIASNIPVVKHRFLNDLIHLDQAYETNNPGTGMSMRLAFWKTASDIIKDSPVFGVGTGDYEDAMNSRFINNDMPDLLGANPHNQYLQTAVMFGLTGMIYLVSMLIFPFIKAYKRRDFIYIFFILITLIIFLTESTLQANKGIVFFALFNSLYIFHPKNV